jgi:hypothetical protein
MKPNLLLSALLFVAVGAHADPQDPKLPPPNYGASPIKSLGVGSLIDSVAMIVVDPETNQNKVVVWGYRTTGHSGNYNWNGQNMGWEHGGYPRDFKLGRQMGSVRDFNDPNHPLGGQTPVKLFATAHTILALTEEGELWGWGDSLHGTAGCMGTDWDTPKFGTFTQYNSDFQLQARPHFQARPCPAFSASHNKAKFRNIKISEVATGEYNVVALSGDGRIFTWGNDIFGQTVTHSSVPTGNKGEPVEITHFFTDKDGDPETVITVGGAYEGQYALTHDKNGDYSVWAWGRSWQYSLGNRATDYYIYVPTRLPQYAPFAPYIKKIAGGYGTTFVLLNDGTIWGSGDLSKLGQGATNYRKPQYEPVQVLGPKSIVRGNGTKYDSFFTKLEARYIGGIAVAEGDPNNQGKGADPNALYHWGNYLGSDRGAYEQIYGAGPVRREAHTRIRDFGGQKEAIYYMTEDAKLFGMGYSNQRVINICGVNTISWDNSRTKHQRKNSMNWLKKRNGQIIPGGYRIPYENAIDTVEDLCAGSFTSGIYSGKTKADVYEWTGYPETEADGPLPPASEMELHWCTNAEEC